MNGIWKYSDRLNPNVSSKNQLSLNEGQTPLETVTLIDEVYLKREDKNPTGSQKDRSIAFFLSALIQRNIFKFCISSTGSAAISACAYFNIIENDQKQLDVFLSPNIASYKLDRINKARQNNGQITIHFTKTAKKDCFMFAKNTNFYNLRGSTDPLALQGFKTIGYELQQQIPDCDGIFIPVSSATTFMGIYESYDHNLPALHAVQTSKVHPISMAFDHSFIVEKNSHATAIADIIAYRKNDTIEAINRSHGFGWVVEDNDLVYAYNEFKKIGLNISYDSSLALAGYFKALKHFKYKKPVLLLTGI